MPDVQDGGNRRGKTTGCCCFSSHKHAAANGMNGEAAVVASKKVLSQSEASLLSTIVPYATPVPSNLQAGKCLHLTAHILPKCTRFSVNLLCGNDSRSDIALHMNPRLSQRYLVRNCRLRGRWGEEETTSIQPFGFRRNTPFLLTVLMGLREFFISLDGRHLCAFAYRVPLEHVCSVEVHGAVEVHALEFADMELYPEMEPGTVPVRAFAGDQPEPVDNENERMEVPSTLLLTEGLKEGWQLEIHGRVKILPHSFIINLQEGHQLWPHPVIHLHLNPRFSTQSGEHVFVRNAWIEGSWGAEERVPSFRFMPGHDFVLIIWRTGDLFSVWVDGQLVGEFPFRADADKINAVYVQGDIVLKRIFLVEKGTAPRLNGSA